MCTQCCSRVLILTPRLAILSAPIAFLLLSFFIFFFNDTATTEIYTLSLHDALPISPQTTRRKPLCPSRAWEGGDACRRDRKSTRLNSSHRCISYAVFCLKKKKKKQHSQHADRNSASAKDAGSPQAVLHTPQKYILRV